MERLEHITLIPPEDYEEALMYYYSLEEAEASLRGDDITEEEIQEALKEMRNEASSK